MVGEMILENIVTNKAAEENWKREEKGPGEDVTTPKKKVS